MSPEEAAHRPQAYISPQGYRDYLKTLPFLGRLSCPLTRLEAGSWQEIVLDYEVGAAGLADGAWIKITFKFYSDWALLQTDEPEGANYLSAEYQARPAFAGESRATVQSLHVRFDQKGHERPFQKAIIVDIVDGYLKPGDHIIVRLGDRRAGGSGTRVQTFVEEGFRFRGYIDATGTSRFAAIPGDTVLDIIPGAPAQLVTLVPALVKTGEHFPILMRLEDRWGNLCRDLRETLQIISRRPDGQESQAFHLLSQENDPPHSTRERAFPAEGWAVLKEQALFTDKEAILLEASVKGIQVQSQATYIKAEDELPYARPFFADLHVHSNHTIGTNSTSYNFLYGRDAAALDVLGYTANDFHITEEAWKKDVELCRSMTREGEFLCYPGTEWCGNSAVGGDHNVVFLEDEVRFPFDREGQVLRSFEWNEEMQGNALVPGAWPIDKLYEAYMDQAEDVLLIPHVGGRRAILDWHHPELERLIEIGSAWGHFPWFYQEAISRGYKLGVSAAGDEHRARSGGGAPGAAVFGVKGGLTGIIAPSLTRVEIKNALRQRHTWATTGERSVALLQCGPYIQGDAFTLDQETRAEISYRFVGNAGWDEICAYTDQGLLWRRNLHEEAGFSSRKIRLRWGGARIRDRYRAAEWRGTLRYRHALVNAYTATGFEHPEEYARRSGPNELTFRSDTYGDSDALELDISNLENGIFEVHARLDGYVKIGNPLAGNPYIHAPEVHWHFTGQELLAQNTLHYSLGGADLFLMVERLSEQALPRDIEGTFFLEPRNGPHGFVPVYLMGRQSDDAKAWTSPLFVTFA